MELYFTIGLIFGVWVAFEGYFKEAQDRRSVFMSFVMFQLVVGGWPIMLVALFFAWLTDKSKH
jgi:hypothetical protein